MRCPYCLQQGAEVPANRRADVTGFAEKLSAHLAGDQPERIMIWGGEPMLYWRRIHGLLDAFERFGVNPEQGFIITTNGRGLTDEYVDYANEHPIWTTVSTHDWQFTNDQLDRIFMLDRFSMSAILHRTQFPLWHLRERYYKLEDRYGIRPRLYLHFLRANEACSPDFYLSKEDVDRLAEHLINDVLTLATLGDDWARWQCAQLLSENRREIEKGEGGKCVRSDRLSVDLHGNVYACHHNYDASNIVGNLFRKTIPIHTVGSDDHGSGSANPFIHSLPSPGRYADIEPCRSCAIFRECRGGCYLSRTHEIDCYLARRMAGVYRMFESVLKL